MDDKEKNTAEAGETQENANSNSENSEKETVLSKLGNKIGLGSLKHDKLKRYKTIAMLAATILFLSLIITFVIRSGSKPIKIRNKAPVSLLAPSGLAKHNWIINNSAKLRNLSSGQKQLKTQVENIKKQLNKKMPANKSFLGSGAKPFGAFPPPPPPYYNKKYVNGNVGGVSPQSQKARPIYRTTHGLIGSVSFKIKKKKNTNNKTFIAPDKPVNTAVYRKNSGAGKENILPGSFVKAVLLTGAEVPTSGGGSVGPVPILLRVVSTAQLPNFFKTNIDNCFMVGQAKGSLSSGRAYIRISKLSCVSKSGAPISKSITATAVGEDGKVGLAGKVVTKQGALLARVLVAGFLQGVGQAFQQSSQNLTFSGLTGSTTQQPIVPSGRELLSVGIGGGVSQATQKLAQFYMNMANKMFPVIQINAGRTIDVMFMKGVSLP